jgi:ATP-dependent DNA ligase
MEAELVDELPTADEWQYEPKWDGFRGILENLGGEVHLWSRNARPLLRYFPELRALGERLPPKSAVDGEIIVETNGKLDFDVLQMRLHPAESRVKRLSAEHPAGFVAFDVLLWEKEPVHRLPVEERRARVEKLPYDVSPASRDPKVARRWLERLEVAGFDGVIAKRLGSAYLPGSREAVQKVKRHRTVDCVVVGVTWKENADQLANLLLGLYDDGEIRHVGAASVGTRDRELVRERLAPLLGRNPKRMPRGEPSRWRPKGELEWTPVKPKLVVEVRYDKWQGSRIRHVSRFLRFRPDKNPKQCTIEQVQPRPRRGDPTVSKLLTSARSAT